MKKNHHLSYALISVSKKEGIVSFAKNLSLCGIQLLATSGTAQVLKKEGIKIIDISNYINFPEIMEGKIKTIHPKIYGGILSQSDQDLKILTKHNIIKIDMVVVNFYSFYKNNITFDETKNIDIGGPSMVRAAAKNYKNVTVVIDNKDYDEIISKLRNNTLTVQTRLKLATKAFNYVTEYDNAIALYFNNLIASDKKHLKNFPSMLHFDFFKKEIRYGENKHQNAAFYTKKNLDSSYSEEIQQLQGKTLSYNNMLDTDIALECVLEFKKAACVIVKHTNPCAVALNDDIFHAYKKAYKADPISAFGGIIAFNRILDENTVKCIFNTQFVEIIIAPAITVQAKKIISKKPKVRILIFNSRKKIFDHLEYRSIHGGLLVQDRNLKKLNKNQIHIVSKKHPNKIELNDALFSWTIVKYLKSNAIVYVKNNTTVGIGTGQTNRVFSEKIARLQAENLGLKVKNCVMASDAFFPFRDSIDAAAVAGVKCIIQPGGSIRDKEIIDAANKHNIVMLFTNIRHLRH